MNLYKKLRHKIADLIFQRKRQMRIISKSGLFNAGYYLKNNPDVAGSGCDPLRHFVYYGSKNLLNPSNSFDTAYYTKRYKFSSYLGQTALFHYIIYGYWEGYITTNDGSRPVPNIKRIALKRRIKELLGIAKPLVKPTYKGKVNILPKPEEVLSENGLVFCGTQIDQKVFDLAKYFIDDSILAAFIVDAQIDEFRVCSSYQFVADTDISNLKISRTRCILRVATGFNLSCEVWADDHAFTDFVLRHVAAGSVAVINSISYSPTNDIVPAINIIERELLLLELYNKSLPQVKKRLEKIRLQSLETTGENLLTQIIELSNNRSSKRRIIISIYNFVFGGGEIMPIRLANELRRIGHPVLVHVLGGEEDYDVRMMLRGDIPVIATNDTNKLAECIKIYGMELINTHHQAMQTLCALMMRNAGVHIRHVATSHGMYDAFDEKTLEYVLHSQLSGHVDDWTYVADKNLLPFQKQGVYNSDHFFKIPNGMEKPTIKKLNRLDYRIPNSAFVFALVSRALFHKGWLEALAALKLARELSGLELHLLLVGSGPAYEQLSKQADLPPYIHLLGQQKYPCDWYNIADAGILPTSYKSESAPLTLIECLMCSKPFLSTDIGEIRNMLTLNDKMAGMLIPLSDEKIDIYQLADKMIEFATDKNKYQQMCRTATDKSIEFSISAVADKYLHVYNLDIATADNNPMCELNKTYKNTLDLLNKSNTNPHVTVIVPNYNHARYLKRRLESIYNQTYTNFDVLLLDDCSTDSSRDILEAYAAKYPHKTNLLFNTINSGGVFHQWKKGILSAQGDLCWIAETDDWCDVTFLEKLVPMFLDKEVQLAYAHYIFSNADGELKANEFEGYLSSFTDSNNWHNNFIKDSRIFVEEALGIGNAIPNASGVVFRKVENMSLLDDPTWINMRICGDWIFYLHIAYGGKIAYSSEVNSYFTLAAGSAGQSTYKQPCYYQEHAQVAYTVAKLYKVSEDVIRKSISRVKAFGKEQKVSKHLAEWYNAESVLKNFKENIGLTYAPANAKFNATDIVFISQIEQFKAGAKPGINLFKYLGENSGNMVFTEAIRQQIVFNKEVYDPFADDFSKITGYAGILPVANMIIQAGPNNIPHTLKFYQQTNFPVTMAGLGAQCEYKGATPKQLVNKLDTQRKQLFQLAANRAVTLGVRGRFTADCLEELGIYNYRIIGCPSIYKHFDGIWPQMQKASSNRPIICATRNQAQEATSELQSKIIRLGMQANAQWIVQMPTELPAEVFDGKLPDISDIERMYPHEKWDVQTTSEYFLHNTHYFINMQEWDEYLQKGNFTFAFGSRFHGIVSALRNGIPGLLLVHDSRTLELAEYLHLPYITPEEFEHINTWDELIKRCNYTEFYEHYKLITKNYVEFLEENNLPHRFSQNR